MTSSGLAQRRPWSRSGSASPFAAAPRPTAAAYISSERGVVDGAGDRLAVAQQRDRDRVAGIAVDERRRAVERVDHPDLGVVDSAPAVDAGQVVDLGLLDHEARASAAARRSTRTIATPEAMSASVTRSVAELLVRTSPMSPARAASTRPAGSCGGDGAVSERLAHVRRPPRG